MSTRKKYIHFTGIKGVGMTALALYMRDLGNKVTGSDVSEIFVTDETLRKAKIDWKVGFSPDNLSLKPDLVITTGAHGGLRNPEVVAAKDLGIRVLTYAEALAEVSKEKDLIAVCGVGGKGTTASVIVTVLDYAKKHPSFVIGMGSIYPVGFPGRYNLHGANFICEADEYAISPGINNKPKFSLLDPKILVVTNIEHDHPDIYPTLGSALKVYRKFFENIPQDGLLIACVDNVNVGKVIKGLNVPVSTYGFSKDADWRICDVVFKNQGTLFKVKNGKTGSFVLSVPGEFNVRNATAALIAADFLKIGFSKVREGLAKYKGCRRRFQKMGEYKRALFYDDYAHHPEEIKSVLKATRQWFPERRIVAVFQPHTYSRTKALFKEFSKSFSDADIVGIMDIYASARETKDDTVSSKKLADETKKFKKDTYYTSDHSETLEWLGKTVRKGDIVLTMGAGNIFHLYKDLV